jgi:Na+/H+ antiporter NhaD/arsenite permease-like protein
LASNIGGASTLVGDPPNIIIASRGGLTFNDFLIHMTPIVVIVMAVFIALLPLIFRGSFDVDPARVADIMALVEREAIRDPALLIKCGVVLVAVFTAFITHTVVHIEPSIIALLGAGVLILLSRLEARDYLAGVEWETLLFFVGLFVMVGALEHTGAIDEVAQGIGDVTAGDRTAELLGIAWVSALGSGLVDNIPFTAAMIPVVESLQTAGDDAYWWALALGACFGGNATLVAAAANVAAAGMAARSGRPIAFMAFLRIGVPATLASMLIATAYIALRYL